uniref:Uncharacterized protein n=1 Tax=Arundo donax TaxID=35708 RepID=A0A0A9BN89_ARUDO
MMHCCFLLFLQYEGPINENHINLHMTLQPVHHCLMHAFYVICSLYFTLMSSCGNYQPKGL